MILLTHKNLEVNTMSYKFYEICQKIKNEGLYVNYTNTSEFMYYLGFKHKQYSGYIQHDTQEFCRIFLDDFSKDLNRVIDVYVIYFIQQLYLNLHAYVNIRLIHSKTLWIFLCYYQKILKLLS